MTELATSLTFYVGVLEFRVLVARPVERFAYLERGGVELMLQEAAGPGRRFRTAPLTYPFGGGVNFQLRVEEKSGQGSRLRRRGDCRRSRRPRPPGCNRVKQRTHGSATLSAVVPTSLTHPSKPWRQIPTGAEPVDVDAVER